jgi:Brix domain
LPCACQLLPAASYYKRGGYPLKKIVQYASNRGFTDLMVFNENRKSINGLVLVHLPDGPSAHFKVSNVVLSNDIKVRGMLFSQTSVCASAFALGPSPIRGCVWLSRCWGALPPLSSLTSLTPLKSRVCSLSCFAKQCIWTLIGDHSQVLMSATLGTSAPRGTWHVLGRAFLLICSTGRQTGPSFPSLWK